MNGINGFRHINLLRAGLLLFIFTAACGTANSPTATGDIVKTSPTASIAVLETKPAESPVAPSATAESAAGDANTVVRGNLERSREKFTQTKTGRVAFLGGSVTNLAWREAVMRYLLKRFPETKFDFINAGLNGTSAELGAFRMEEDVFGRGPVDLLFLEFAVNGGSIEAMEGIVRHARALSPEIDIIQMHIAARWFSDSLDAGSIPGAVADHERVAAHYGNSSLHLYKEIHDRMKKGDFTWAEFAPDGVHPSAFGSTVYAEFIDNFLEMMWARPDEKAQAAVLPPPLTKAPWEHGSLIPFEKAASTAGFETVKNWYPERNGNLKGPLNFLAASAPGASLSFAFQGTIVGLYSVVGPDSAVVEYRIDDREWKQLDTARDSWYPNDWYRLNGFVLETALADSAHTITFRTTENPGRVFRLFRLMVG
jgi:sialidase-1